MANIASQEKRIHRAERERLENRRRTSQVKTWFRRLESAVAEGDAAKADDEFRSARLADRQGREVGRAAPQQRRPQEVARRAHPQAASRNARLETRLLIRGEQVAGDGDAARGGEPGDRGDARGAARSPPPSSWTPPWPRRSEAFAGWAGTPAVERAEMLHEVATRLRAQTDELARTMTLEGGKPLIENSDEVGWTAAAFDYYAEMGRNFAGRVIPSIEATQLALVLKEPIGVWGCIVPWNYPLLLLSWKLAPALAAGNTVVAKPSELTPLSTLMLAAVLRRTCRPASSTSWPARATWARRSSRTSASTGVAFTGSVETGKRVAAACAERVARMNLEMGGKDPFIVCADVAADVEVAAKGGAWAAYLNAGQVCTSAERFYVAREVYDDFVSAFVDYTSSLRVGDPLDADDRRRADGVGARSARRWRRSSRPRWRRAPRWSSAATAPGRSAATTSPRRS